MDIERRNNTAMKIGHRAALIALVAMFIRNIADACPSCYGAADGPVIEATNTAILAMLGITGTVLTAIGTFFVVIIRRARTFGQDGSSEGPGHFPGAR